MTREELEAAFKSEFTRTDKEGNPVLKKSPADIIGWLSQNLSGPPFSKAFTGMRDKNGKSIHEGDSVKIYHKGEFVVCKVVYDVKHAAFFIKWPDGYVNQYFMNGSSYEVTDIPG